MIQRFNFYDIYGYFLPGFTLLSLILLPPVLARNSWLAVGWTGAAAMIVFSYIVGHVLQNLARQILPSMLKKSGDREDVSRHPSDFILDAGDTSLDDDLKQRLGEYAKREFKLDISVEKGRADWSKEVGRKRGRAFFMARTALISRGIAGYAEQFEGMYSLMRGLSAAFFLGGVYALGWLFSPLTFAHAKTAASVIVLLGLAIALCTSVATHASDEPKRRKNLDRATSVLVMVVLVAAGYRLSAGALHASDRSAELGALSLVAWFFSRRCYLGYQFFAKEFAMTVWRDFAACHLSSSPGHSQ